MTTAMVALTLHNVQSEVLKPKAEVKDTRKHTVLLYAAQVLYRYTFFFEGFQIGEYSNDVHNLRSSRMLPTLFPQEDGDPPTTLKTTWQQHSHPNSLKAAMTVTIYLALYPQDVYYDGERNDDCLASWVRHFHFILHCFRLCSRARRLTYCIATTLPTLVSHGHDPTP
jgi:hypothetical protein